MVQQIAASRVRSLRAGSVKTVQLNNIKKIGFAAIAAGATLLMTEFAYGFDGSNNAFERSRENGVTVWRANVAPAPKDIPELLGDEPVIIQKEVIVKREVVRVPRFRPAKARVIGHFSGYGERIPFVQGFYSGYPRSKNSRNYVQGFFSGTKTNRKRRFPQERSNGSRRF